MRHFKAKLVWLVAVLAVFPSQGITGAQEQSDALFRDFRWRSIGPANMQGRITDIEALDSDYRFVVAASASGGVFKSANAGTTWEPIFDRYGTAAIGDVAICQTNRDIIWVGTGEPCVRNSVSWGDGVYKSTDGGRSFTNMGLKESHHISEVAIHPQDPDTVYVAAQGRLWGYNEERGLYKTTDGGKTWKKLDKYLPNDGRTGCSDVKIDPANPDTVYAAFWERIRRPWRFDSGGPNGGIFKSTNGGETWSKLTNGLPEGPTGKIGLALHPGKTNIIMAIVEHGFQPNARTEAEAYKDMTQLGTGIYRSEDGGGSWKYVNRFNNRPFYYSHIYMNPGDENLVYVLATTAMQSRDGGRTLAPAMRGIAGDFHALWVDPHQKDRYYVGNDKGISLTHDHGDSFLYFDNLALGQFYAIAHDMRDPYYVYGGLQDNGVWGGPSNSRESTGILTDHWFKFHSGDGFHVQVDPADWTTVYTESQGGAIRRNHAVFRQNSVSIRPNPDNIRNFLEVFPEGAGESRASRQGIFRNNWSTPFVISPHDPRTLYYGTQYLLKSADQGDSWRIISPDLSTNDPERTNRDSGGLTRDVTGAETNATIVTISESPRKAGLIWVGTDDGRVQVTQNDGISWSEVTKAVPGLPQGLWVSRVRASHHDESTAYLAVDGHRSDNFDPFVYRTTDSGKTWTSIRGNLPGGHPVYVITEDPVNRNLLFVGTESAVFVSADGGSAWNRLMTDLPTVPVHDLLIHPRDGDLIAGTHGRSIWILDDITPLQQLSGEVRTSEAFLFQPKTATIWRGISRGAERGNLFFQGRNPLTIAQRPPANSPPELQNSAFIHYYLESVPEGDVRIEIADAAGSRKRVVTVPKKAGINRWQWDMRLDPTRFDRELTQLTRQLREAATDEDRKRMIAAGRKALTELAETEAQRRELDARLMLLESMEPGSMGGPAMAMGGAAGPAAEPGVYTVKLHAGGRTYEAKLTVRMDPLFEELAGR